MTKQKRIQAEFSEEIVSIHSGNLLLEGVLLCTHSAGQPGLVFCHPHSLYNGSMDDGRLRAISSAAVPEGFNSLRFNFRGVGKSQGHFGQGLGEIQDTIAAVQFLRDHPHVDESRVAIVGYSFGGSIALAAAIDADPAALVVISAALRAPDVAPFLVVDTLRYIRCPTYILHGREDNIIPSANAEGIHAQLQVREKYLRIIRGADHFWRNRLDNIISKILAFLKEKLLSD